MVPRARPRLGVTTLPSPDDVTDRESFHAAVRSLLQRPAVSKDQHTARVEQAEREGFVVQPHARATTYSWGKGSLPQKSGGPYVSFLLSRGVAVEELETWVGALERARRTPAPAEPEGGPDDLPDEDPAPVPQRRRWLVVAAVAIVVVLVGITLVVRDAGSEASPLPSAVGEPFLREDFTDPLIPPATWLPPSEPAHLYAADRVLNLVSATDADPREIDSDLAPRDPLDFREIDFVVSNPDVAVPGAGGASLVVTEQGGRTHMLVFGPAPGPPPAPLAAALICSRPSCRSYDDYDPPPPTRPFEYFAGPEVVPFRVVQNDGFLTFSMRGQEMGRAPVTEPLRSFRFNAYSGPDERWRVTVDAVRVYR